VSKISQHFMGDEGSVQLSHEPTTCLGFDLHKFRPLPHCISRIFILIISFNVPIDIYRCSFFQGFPPNLCRHFCSPPIDDTTLAYFIFLDLITSKIFGEGNTSRNSSLCFFFSPFSLLPLRLKYLAQNPTLEE